ncbi:hypothetical protein HA48_11710 [Pantoea wallisii]|uniref:Uncharacterized protein n=1 Tax=Pantoea wallisii TaxID=1076551 RepID=A0A1X1D8U1_9GAMM|nr:hypothetical protein [Pantoea wallisii]ORM73037.1 hypothetical protein HA48_11710 [Pantoea wallisii]
MNEKTQRRLQKIELKIKSNNFSKAELLSFRMPYKNLVKKLSEEGVARITLCSAISYFSNDAFSVIAIYFYMCIFFLVAFLFVGEFEGSVFFFSVIAVMAVLHIFYAVNKNDIKYTTYLKLVKLYLKSLF